MKDNEKLAYEMFYEEAQVFLYNGTREVILK